jgi:hypothetical protein
VQLACGGLRLTAIGQAHPVELRIRFRGDCRGRRCPVAAESPALSDGSGINECEAATMTITEHDLELFAARIRPHFPLELRDTAYELALSIARVAGPKAKLLTPDTTIDTIIEWTDAVFLSSSDSLDRVEQVMALEEELGSAFVLPDEIAARTDRATFRDWVEHAAKARRAA